MSDNCGFSRYGCGWRRHALATGRGLDGKRMADMDTWDGAIMAPSCPGALGSLAERLCAWLLLPWDTAHRLAGCRHRRAQRNSARRLAAGGLAWLLFGRALLPQARPGSVTSKLHFLH